MEGENEKSREISSSGYDELCIYIKSIIYSRELWPENLQLKVSALNKLRRGIGLLVNTGKLELKREQGKLCPERLTRTTNWSFLEWHLMKRHQDYGDFVTSFYKVTVCYEVEDAERDLSGRIKSSW